MPNKKKYPLQGIIVSLNTPFDEKGKIDIASLDRLVEYHLAAGAVGFLTPARAAELDSLSREEKSLIIGSVHEHIKGRAEIIAGATSADQIETFAIAEAAVRLGCKAVLSEIPEHMRTNRAQTLDFACALASIGMPVLMIQDLDWRGGGLPVPIIAELFEAIDSFRCLKVEVMPAGPKYSAVLEATGGRLHVSGGWAAEQMIEALQRGVDAYMPTAMTALYKRVYDSFRAGDIEDARHWFHRILPVLAFTRQHLDISIQFYKRWYHRLGIFSTPQVRGCAVVYDACHESYGQDLMAYVESVEQELRVARPVARPSSG